MRKFNVCCVDIKTHMEMIAEDASYNEVCFWLERQGITTEKIVTDSKKGITVLVTDKGVFLYDEFRGVLVRD